MFPPDTQDEEAARWYVEAALDWCENKAVPLADARAACPTNPVERMRAVIARERRVQRTMSGPYLQDSFNWQAGVDRLWKRWDELLPDTVRPDKPICTNYAEASDAAVALLRALQSVRPPAAGGWPSIHEEQRLRLAQLVAQIIGESRQGFQPAAAPLPGDARGDAPPAERIAELIRLLHTNVGNVRPAMMRAGFTAVEAET